MTPDMANTVFMIAGMLTYYLLIWALKGRKPNLSQITKIVSTKPAWCQGCDQLQPTASMGFTEIGLYRCGVCREPPLADKEKRARVIGSHKGWPICSCNMCESRHRMQALAAQSMECHTPVHIKISTGRK